MEKIATDIYTFSELRNGRPRRFGVTLIGINFSAKKRNIDKPLIERL